MPYVYEFVEAADDCVVVTWTGVLSVDEFSAFFDELSGRSEFQPGLNRLYDFRAAYIALTREALHALRVRTRQSEAVHGERKVALLVSPTLSYGVARMYMTLADLLIADLKVLWESEEAKAWVGLRPDYVLPADRDTPAPC